MKSEMAGVNDISRRARASKIAWICLASVALLIALVVPYVIAGRYSLLPTPGKLGESGVVYRMDKLTGKTVMIIGGVEVDVGASSPGSTPQPSMSIPADDLAQLKTFDEHADTSTYLQSSGYLSIRGFDGKIQNTLTRPVRALTMKYTIADESGSILHTEEHLVVHDTLQPGDAKSFTVSAFIQNIPRSFKWWARVSNGQYESD